MLNNIHENEKVNQPLWAEVKKTTKWLENVSEKQANKILDPILDNLPSKEFDISAAKWNIENTVKKILKDQEGSTLNKLIDKVSKAESLWDKISVLFESFTELLQALFEATWDDWESLWEELVQYETMDYTSYTLDDLGWTINPPVSVQDALENNPYPQESILYQIIEQIRSSNSIYDRLAWSSAYSSALITYRYKLNHPDKHVVQKDIIALSWKEKIGSSLKKWDLIVIWWSTGWFVNNVLRNQSLSNDHVMVYAWDDTVYHSTMRTWADDKWPPWFEKRNIRDELAQRKPCRITIVRPPKTVDTDGMIRKANEMVEHPQWWYNYFDAALSMFGMWVGRSNKANCWKFAWLCLEAWWYSASSIKKSWDPSAFLKESWSASWFSIEYFGKYER